MFKSAAGKVPAVLFLKRHHMNFGTNEHPSEAGKRLLQRLQEKTFPGYARACIDTLFCDVDAGKYTFADIGTSEVAVLDLAIKHVKSDKLDAFTEAMYTGKLVARKKKALGAHLPPSYAHAHTVPHLVYSNNATVRGGEDQKEAA